DEAVRDYPRLSQAGVLAESDSQRLSDIRTRILLGIIYAALFSVAGLVLLTGFMRLSRPNVKQSFAWWWYSQSGVPWRAVWITYSIIMLVLCVCLSLSVNYHVLGTDRTGNDVLWQSLKSIRTALVIGTLTIMAMLPPALGFGIAAGYFKGRVDDVIQYRYTTLTSIPGLLLVAAWPLM